MNLEDIKKNNPFVFTALTQKIRSHLKNSKSNNQSQQKQQKDVQNNGPDVYNAISKRSNSMERQLSQKDINYNTISQAIISKTNTKLEKQIINNNKDQQARQLKEADANQQQPVSQKKTILNHQFLLKSIHQALDKKNQKIQKQAKQSEPTKQIINNNIGLNNSEVPQQTLMNYQKQRQKKQIQIIQIQSDSDADDQINLKQTGEILKNKKQMSKKQKQMARYQQKLRSISKDIGLISKLSNKYPNININQIRTKIFQNYSSNIQQPSQSQEKISRPKIQIKKPFRKQLTHSKMDEPVNQEGERRQQLREPYTFNQYENETQDQQKFVNKYNQQMIRRSKIPSKKESFGPISKQQKNQGLSDFYIHIDLLTDKDVDMDKINLANQSQNKISNYLQSKNIKQGISNSDKYRQQKIQDYFAAKQSKNFVNRIQEQIDKAALEEKGKKQHLNAKKSSKHVLAYPQNHLKLQSIDYQQFIQRRIKKKGEPLDLGVLTIDQIVQQCYIKQILGEEMYVEYINKSTRQKIKQFINYFIDRKVNQWNFQQIKITLMDHRRLAELLVNLYPKEFIIYQPHSIQKHINDFLVNLYLLSSSDYKSLLDSLDHISGVIFWKTFNMKYQKYLNPVKIVPYASKSPIQSKLSYEEQRSYLPQRTQKDLKNMLTQSEKQMIQKYKQDRQKDNRNNYLKRANNYVNTNEDSSSQKSQSSALSPECNLKNSKQIKKTGKKAITLRKRIH